MLKFLTTLMKENWLHSRPSSRLIFLATLLAVLLIATLSLSGPDTEIRLTSFEPTGRVESRVNFTMKFSSDMVSRDSLDRPVLDPPVRFDPPIRGLARWIETDVLRFFPDSSLAPATAYTATIRSDRTWISGLKILSSATYAFRTAGLQLTRQRFNVEQATSYADSVFINGRLAFNYPVELKQLQEKLKITGGKDATAKSLAYTLEVMGQPALEGGQSPALTPTYATQYILRSEPFLRTEKTQQYVITLDKGLSCQNCGIPLEEAVTITATAAPRQPLLIEQAYATSEGEQYSIRVEFSQRISSDDIKPFLTVEPAVDYTLVASWNTLIINADFRAGEIYTVSIAERVPSITGAILDNPFSTKLVIPDLPPSVKFTSRGTFLPKAGNGLLEFKTVNIDKAELEIEQVFANNLVYFLMSGSGGAYDEAYGWDGRAQLLGKSLFIKEKSLTAVKNQPLVTTVDIAGIVGDARSGIFKVSARNKESRWIADSRYVMLTELGISARMAEDYLMVWVNSLTGAEPVSGATVTLYSRNNQMLAQGKTNGRGLAAFPDIASSLKGFQPFVITAQLKDDLSYVRLDESLLPLADFDVAGRPFLTSGYEAFLYTDRGVYRPGDSVHLGVIVRGAGGALPPTFPYFLHIYDPQGRKFTSFRMSTDKANLATLDFAVPDYAATGKYAVTGVIGEDLQIGRVEFLVEDFVPDKIKVVTHTDRQTYHAGDTVRVGVDAKLLFGPPAAGYQLSGNITLESRPFAPVGWSEYSFSNSERVFNRISVDLPDTLLDDTGGGRFVHVLPGKLTAPSSLKGLVSAMVSEPGGRAVAAYAEVVIHPYSAYVGLKESTEGYANIGEPYNVGVIALTADGQKTSLEKAVVRFNSIVYNTVYKRDQGGMYRWVSERKAVLIESDTVPIPAEGQALSYTPSDYGSYQIVVEDLAGGHSSAVQFWASGWGYAPWAMDSPDRIELVLDKPEYTAGEQATVQVRAPFGGKLLLTIERTEVIETITHDMVDNTAEIILPVKKEYLPNVYVTATVLRLPDTVVQNKPARAFGIVPLKISNASKRLDLTLTGPDVVTPRSKVTISAQLGRPIQADLTIAAVDVGILQLTDFQTPDPLEFFHGKKQPYLNAYDLYSFLFPYAKQSESHLAAGDKLFAAARKRHLNPVSAKRIKPVALWSGALKTDKTGAASVSFDIPEFNGKLAIMAVTAQGDLFGSASRDLTVRDRIVLQESFPRFISPNDEFDGLLTLFNNTGTNADIRVRLDIDGPARLVSDAVMTLPVEAGREGRAIFRIRAGQAVGKVKFAAIASAGTDTSRVSIELANRPALPLVTQYGSGVATKAAAAEFTLPGGWLEGTAQYNVRTSAMPATNFARNIEYLLSYPYGCVEQTTSRLFPLLYYGDLVAVAQPVLYGTRGHQYFIQEGITRLSSMVMPDRSFSFWPGGSSANPWATIYASHFLSEASRAGYVVDKKLLDDLYDNLENIAKGKKRTSECTDLHQVYAAYVLAQAGKLEQSVVSILKRMDPAALDVQPRYHLAGALALTGGATDAMKYLPVTIQPNLFDPETGGSFNSGVRTDAIALEVLMILTPNSPSVDALARSLMERASAGQWYTTQENAYALMALGKYFSGKRSFGYAGTLAIAGVREYPIDSTGFTLTRNDLGQKSVSVNVTSGEGSCFYFWQGSGIPSTGAAPEYDRGIKVRRQYLNEDAGEIDPTQVHLGDRIICVLTAETTDKALYNVVLNDLLPAGLEIENPRLKTTPRLSWIPNNAASIGYQDIRDDRLLLFTDLYPGRPMKFYYSLRAIAAGDFKVPPVAAECMYNPLIAGSASSGAITIIR